VIADCLAERQGDGLALEIVAERGGKLLGHVCWALIGKQNDLSRKLIQDRCD